MITKDFYTLLDHELDALLQKYQEDALIKKHRSSANNQKSYALLIWFLEFYGKVSNYTSYITDGNDDSSCDLVLDVHDRYGNKVFYIVQSKWNNAANAEKESDTDEILKALQEFETILRGGKKNVNEKLEKKLDELNDHLKSNGEVRFIFLSLAQYKEGAKENIDSFEKSHAKTRFEVIDINRIKLDYIDRKYKKIEPLNPLESYQNPEESPVTLEVERLANTNHHCIKVEKPFEAYVFLVRPKALFTLFDTYGFSLFYKNVRNPLLQSRFNEEIEKTALENPAYFWYYNNGITAITYLLPVMREQAVKVELTGLQIINGAQTVYSIYRAYKDASPTKRAQMDSEALITLRLLKSGGKDFDLNVTRFTNSQNPVNDRDFCANDDIQVSLQNAFYQKKFWYEKRRGEFRETPSGVHKVPNYVFANAYLAYQLQDPVSVLENYAQKRRTGKDMCFISHRDHIHGLYEKIFNLNTSFEDVLCAFYIFSVIVDEGSYDKTFRSNFYHLLALSRVAFIKYLQKKYNKGINVNKYIIDLCERNDTGLIFKVFKFLRTFLDQQIEVVGNEEKTIERTFKFLFTLSHYEKIKEALEDTDMERE